MARASSLMLVVAVAAAMVGAAGCARVPPYRREILAAPGMRAAPWATVQAYRQHVFEIREATRGAAGAAGAGCGCN